MPYPARIRGIVGERLRQAAFQPHSSDSGIAQNRRPVDLRIAL
jgi:hypothetical protein